MNEHQKLPKELIARLMEASSGKNNPYRNAVEDEAIRRMSVRPMTRMQFRKMCRNLARAAEEHLE